MTSWRAGARPEEKSMRHRTLAALAAALAVAAGAGCLVVLLLSLAR
jgi:hypothetical protein